MYFKRHGYKNEKALGKYSQHIYLLSSSVGLSVMSGSLQTHGL